MKRQLIVAAIAGVVALPVSYLLVPGSGRPDCVDIEVNSSIEAGKLAVLRALAMEYNGSGREHDGVCATVTITATTSGQARLDLVEGSLQPQVWTPTSSLWLELLKHETALTGLPAQADLVSITQSPLTIAMPRQMATALGWPGRGVSWRDILELADDPAGWSSHGHPEWGRFSFGKDNPHRSTSGLAASVATYYAPTGKSSDLRLEDIAKPDVAGFVLGVEGGVHHYAEDAIEFLRTLASYDADGAALTYISAVVLEEQLVYEYNEGAYHQDGEKPAEPLVTLYPTDGTFMMDHPYVVMPWASADERTAAADFLAFLREPQPQQRLAQVGFRYWDGSFQNSDGSRGAWALTADVASSFRAEPVITDARLVNTPSGEVVAGILGAWDQLRKHANILLLLDVSGSMDATTADGETRLQVVKDSVIKGLSGLPDTHNIGLWVFSDTIEPLVPLTRLRDGRSQIEAEVEALEPEGGTALYRAVREAHGRMTEQLAEDRINAVVVLTDGKNEDAEDNDLAALLRDINAVRREASGLPSVRVFSIAFSEDASYEIMRSISSETRAEAYDAQQDAVINQVFADVLSNF